MDWSSFWIGFAAAYVFAFFLFFALVAVAYASAKTIGAFLPKELLNPKLRTRASAVPTAKETKPTEKAGEPTLTVETERLIKDERRDRLKKLALYLKLRKALKLSPKKPNKRGMH